MNKTRCLILSQPWMSKVYTPKLQYRIVYQLHPFCERCNSYYTRQYPTNHYNVLGVERNATYADIKKAYITLSKKHHPDVSSSPGSQKKFVQIREAYDVLSNPSSRQKFDDQLFPKPGIDHSHFDRYNTSDTTDFNDWKTQRAKMYNSYKTQEQENERFSDRLPFVFLVLCILSIGIYFPVWSCMIDFLARPSTREKVQSIQSWFYFKKKSLTKSEKKQDKE